MNTAYADCANSTGLRAGATTPINPGGTPTWFSWQDGDDTISFNQYYGANRPIQSAHPGGANVLMTDGSARFAPQTLELQTFFNLCNRDDGNSVNLP